MISSWVTDRAPWRWAVPTQSAPVSPPPMTTTCLPSAVIGGVTRSPSCTLLASGRYSIAWWTPLRSRPGTGRSRAVVAPAATTTASYRLRRSPAVRSRPISTPVRKRVPSARICSTRRLMCRFSILNSGMPYRSSPPTRSARSYTATVWPARVSCWAAARPAGPEPTTATVLPERRSGGGGDAAGLPRPVDDRDLDVLDGDGRLVDAQHARRLAGGGAQPPGELGEVVGGVQPLVGGAPVPAVDEVVPLGDEVSEGAAVVAERDAAVHAAGRLPADDRQQGAGDVDLVPVLDALGHGAGGGGLAPGGQEALGVSHGSPPPSSSRWSRSRRDRRARRRPWRRARPCTRWG